MLRSQVNPVIGKLLRGFCKTTAKEAHRKKLDPVQLFNRIHEGKLNLEDEIKSGYGQLKEIMQQIRKGETKPQYVPSHRAADVFRMLVENNLLSKSGSEYLVTYLLSIVDPTSQERIAGFCKAYMLDHESWTVTNLKTKLDVLSLLLEYSPEESDPELIAAVDETASNLVEGHASQLQSYDAIDIAASFMDLNSILQAAKQPQLERCEASMPKLFEVFNNELQEVAQGTSIRSMIHVLDLLHFMTDNVSNSRNILEAIETSISRSENPDDVIPDQYWIKVGILITVATEGSS